MTGVDQTSKNNRSFQKLEEALSRLRVLR